MKATLKRFWFWLAQRPPLLISIGVVIFAVSTIVIGTILNPQATNATSSSTSNSSKYGSSNTTSSGTVWTYSDLTAAAAAGQLKSVLISGSSAVATTTDGKIYNVYLPDNNADLAKTLDAAGVKVAYINPSPWTPTTIIEVILLLMLAIGMGFFLWRMIGNRSAMAGNMAFGNSKARIFDPTRPHVTFADVAGADEAKHEMLEIVEFLSNPLKFIKLGARTPRGVLLVGPPGTGKTLLSKAVAGESGATFYTVSGSEFVEMFVGVGAARIRDLFDKAKKNRSAIIFVDEIDALGRERGNAGGGGNDERYQALNQLLVEMDGMETASHVIVIAATNRPDVLDKALLRPGRFDRIVGLDNPNLAGRLGILTVHAKDKPLDPSVSLETIARQTVGLSGADLANLINEAAILAARADRTSILLQDIEDATMRVIAGPEKKSRIINDKEKEVIAYHETGHGLVMHVLPGNDPVTKISVTSRGLALGVTITNPIEDRYLIAKSEIEARLAGIMGGRAAEALVFGDITSGAENDIQKATEWAIRMVTKWGMSEKLGQVALTHATAFGGERGVSPSLAAEIDGEVRAIVDSAYQKAFNILTEHRGALDRIASRLITGEDIDGIELQSLFAAV